ncbi:fructose-1,6-bisphosphatase [Salinirubellus salinus]|jgi:fructose-1,6-bisphosphatase I|uniref:Fructose-1,6-bisphosphatase class 1 n=1 Tax=Salinirubellus salinus TaxID=1364945 RepID=A0A9E7UC47_9EURY|nr:class 1 fructose-bisphosphatase [Salinirubellus salinus]UWM55384.1 fructose-1,6-bisphosphatase [Salinirubellus salinus]
MTVERIVRTVAETSLEVREGLAGRRGYEDEENPSGEKQLAADLWADELFEERLLDIESVAAYASEERSGVVEAERTSNGDGRYHVAVDPLDGSSNLRTNNAMGVLLGVYDSPLPARGRDLVASAYVLFGPLTTMVVAVDGSVTEYVLERDGKSVEMRTVTEELTLPDEPTVYGFGGRVPDWPAGFENYAREIETELKLRYGGAMIADVNQVLTYGGVFAYPGLESRPEGKLRLQFEGNPVAHIVETAGGRSSDGERSLLDVTPERIHQRVPVHVGNTRLIDRLEATLGN